MRRIGLGLIGALGMLILIMAMDGVSWATDRNTSPYAVPDYGSGVSRKLGRGAANLSMGWVEIFKGISDVNEKNNFVAGLTWGPIYGAGKAVVRTLAGAYEIVTFPIEEPKNFAPLIEPEFVLDKASTF